MSVCYSTVQIYVVLSLHSEHFPTYHHGEVVSGPGHVPELEGVAAALVAGEEHRAAAVDGDGGGGGVDIVLRRWGNI